MKIETPDLEVIRPEEMRKIKLRISQDEAVLAVIVKMMADQYKYPLKTLSCEYVSNAIDSHREAGKKNVPIHIHLPNKLDPYFKVRDFGVSMSSEVIENVFSELFASTKRDNDLDIGGFGVGRLVFGAYTGTMTITTYLDGMKTEYFFYLKNGKGDITEMMSVESDEPQGVEISIPIKPEDFHELMEICKEQYAFLSPKPVFSGNSDFNFNGVEYLLERPTFCFKDASKSKWNGKLYDNTSPVATIAGLPYPIDTYACGLEQRYREILGRGAVLHFNIGEVDIVPSRDNLKYTQKTKDAIKKRVEEIVEVAQEEIDRLCESQNFQNEYEARLLWHNIFNSSGQESFLGFIVGKKNVVIKYNGKVIDSSNIDLPFMEVDDDGGRKIKRYKAHGAFHVLQRRSGRLKTSSRYMFWCSQAKYIWVNSLESQHKVSKKVKQFMADNKLDEVYTLRGEYGYTLQHFLEDMDIPEGIIVDSLDIGLAKNYSERVASQRLPSHVVRRAHEYGSYNSRSGSYWTVVEELDLQVEDALWCNRDGEGIAGFSIYDRGAINFLIGEYNRRHNVSYSLYAIPPSKNKRVGEGMVDFVQEANKIIEELKVEYNSRVLEIALMELRSSIASEFSFLFHEEHSGLADEIEMLDWFKYFLEDYKKYCDEGATKRMFDRMNVLRNIFVQLGRVGELEEIKDNKIYKDHKENFEGFKKKLDFMGDLYSLNSRLKINIIKLVNENIILKTT